MKKDGFLRRYLLQCFSPNTTTTTTVTTNTVTTNTRYSTADANSTAITNTTTTTTTKKKCLTNPNSNATTSANPNSNATTSTSHPSKQKRSNSSSFQAHDNYGYLPATKKDYYDHHNAKGDDEEYSSTEDQLDYYPNPTLYPNPNSNPITYPSSNYHQYPTSNQNTYSNPNACYSNPNPNQYPDSNSNPKQNPSHQNGNQPSEQQLQQQQSKAVVIGTFYGHRRGHICFCIQNDRHSSKPTLLLELSIPTDDLVKEMEREVVRIVLECDASHSSSSGDSLLSIPIWTMYINGRSVGFAAKRKPTDKDLMVLRTMQSTTVGAGVIPEELASSDKAGELIFMRANYKRVVGSPDSESFHLTNPDGCLTQELSVFLMRAR